MMNKPNPRATTNPTMELKPIAYDAGHGFIIQQVTRGFMDYKPAWEIVRPCHIPDFYFSEYGSAEEALAALQELQQKHPNLFREAGCS
jgi:hypothetical protein